MDTEIIALNAHVDDENIERKKEIVDHVQYLPDGYPLFSIVEISESGVCNRACSFCPRSAPDFEENNEFISQKMILSIARQLGDLRFSGLILFSGFVEPLLDKRIHQHVAVLREHVPNAEIQIVSNGDPITVKLLNRLAESGLSRLLLSLYDGPDQIKTISGIVEQSAFPLPSIVFRRRWSNPDGSLPISLSNRGGLMANAEFAIGNLDTPLMNVCNYPAQTFFIDYTGEVLLCAHDWGKKFVCGDITTASMVEVWRSSRFTNARQQLLEGTRKITPCNQCNVKGDRMGNFHAAAFRSVHKAC